MDELMRRRFDRAAATIVRSHLKYNEAIRQLNESFVLLEAHLLGQILMIERSSGPTEATERLRLEIKTCLSTFTEATAPIEAVQQALDDVSISIARLAGALP